MALETQEQVFTRSRRYRCGARVRDGVRRFAKTMLLQPLTERIL